MIVFVHWYFCFLEMLSNFSVNDTRSVDTVTVLAKSIVALSEGLKPVFEILISKNDVQIITFRESSYAFC